MNRWRYTRLAALARRLGMGRNTLRRPVDHAENVFLLAAVLIAVAVVPFALSFGTAVYHHNLAVSATQAASRHQVTAVLIDTAPLLASEAAGSTVTWVSGRWIGPHGAHHAGQVPASFGSQAGSPVRIWNDGNGILVDPPITVAQAKIRGMLTVTVVMIATLAVLACLFALLRASLNRVRDAAWDADWQRVGPRWTTRAN